MKKKLNIQVADYDGYLITKSKYETTFDGADKQRLKIEKYQDTVRAAQMYNETMQDLLTGPQRQNAMGQLEQVRTKMANEIQNTEAELAHERRNLTGLQNRLGELQNQYNRARQQEEAEAAAAAAAAARVQ